MSDLADERRALTEKGADVAGLYEALEFAVEAHGRVHQARKGTSFPYVIHPLRVGEILYRHGCDGDIIRAGLLHDTIEDAQVSREELADRFGERVAAATRRGRSSTRARPISAGTTASSRARSSRAIPTTSSSRRSRWRWRRSFRASPGGRR